MDAYHVSLKDHAYQHQLSDILVINKIRLFYLQIVCIQRVLSQIILGNVLVCYKLYVHVQHNVHTTLAPRTGPFHDRHKNSDNL